MKISLVFFVLFAVLFIRPRVESIPVQSNSSMFYPRILGGRDLPMQSPWFPSFILKITLWYIDVFSNKRIFHGWCASTVLNNRTLLTAAHCIKGIDIHKPMATYVRVHDEFDNEMPNVWGLPIIYPEYNPIRHINDIAIVRLNQAITPERMHVRIASKSDYASNHNCQVIGYGGDGKTQSKHLQAFELPLGTNEVCRAGRKRWNIDREFCTLDPENKKKVCEGDGGKIVVYYN